MRRNTPVPLIAAALLLALWIATAQQGSVPGLRCAEHYKQLIAEIERNRTSAIAEINKQIDEAEGQVRVDLVAMRERVWDDEEEQRNIANQILFDCRKAEKVDG